MNQDRDIVKIGKQELVQKTKLNWNSKDNETLIHMDFSRPKLKGYVAGTVQRKVSPCKTRHSNRLTYDPKTKKFLCSECGREPRSKK